MSLRIPGARPERWKPELINSIAILPWREFSSSLCKDPHHRISSRSLAHAARSLAGSNNGDKRLHCAFRLARNLESVSARLINRASSLVSPTSKYPGYRSPSMSDDSGIRDDNTRKLA